MAQTLKPSRAKKLAEAAGFEFYYDHSLRLWACYHDERNARGEPGSEAVYFTKATLAEMTEAEFVQKFLT